MANNLKEDIEWPALSDVAHKSRSTDRPETKPETAKIKSGSKKKKTNWNKVAIETPSYRERRQSEFGRFAETGNQPHHKNRNGYNSESRRGNRGKSRGGYGQPHYRKHHYSNSYPPLPFAETLTVNDTVLHVVNGTALTDAGLIQKIQIHLEYLLSDANLITDEFLRMRMDNRGFIPLALFLGCPRNKYINATIQELISAAQQSYKMEFESHFVRRIVDPLRWKNPRDGISLYFEQYEYIITNGLWMINIRDPDVNYSTDNVQDFQLEGAMCSTSSASAPVVSDVVNPELDSEALLSLQNYSAVLQSKDYAAPSNDMVDSQHETPSLNGIANSEFKCDVSVVVNRQFDSELQSEDCAAAANGMVESHHEMHSLNGIANAQFKSDDTSGGAIASTLEDGTGNLQPPDSENCGACEAAPPVGTVAELVSSDVPTLRLEASYSVVDEDVTKSKLVDSPASDKTPSTNGIPKLQLRCVDSPASDNKTSSTNGVAKLQLTTDDVCEGAVASALEDNFENLHLHDLGNFDLSEPAVLVDDEAELVCSDVPTVLLETTFSVDEGARNSKLAELSPVKNGCIYFSHEGLTNSLSIVPVNGYNTEAPSESVSSVYCREELCTAVNSSDCAVHMSPEPLR